MGKSPSLVILSSVLAAALFLPFASLSAETIKVMIGGGRAEVQASYFLNDQEKLQQTQLELLLDRELATAITDSRIQIFTFDLNLSESDSPRKIAGSIKKFVVKELEKQASLPPDLNDAMSDPFWGGFPGWDSWTFEWEAVEEGDWEAAGLSLFARVKRWMSETYNWILLNLFKIFLFFFIGYFATKLARGHQNRSLVFLRRRPFLGFMLALLFSFIIGAIAVALTISIVGIPFVFLIGFISILFLFLGYLLTAQFFLYLLSRVFPFLWTESVAVKIFLSLILITVMEYYVPHLEYIVGFFVISAFGSQVKELFAPSPRASVN